MPLGMGPEAAAFPPPPPMIIAPQPFMEAAAAAAQPQAQAAAPWNWPNSNIANGQPTNFAAGGDKALLGNSGSTGLPPPIIFFPMQPQMGAANGQNSNGQQQPALEANGGLPQATSMRKNLEKMPEGILMPPPQQPSMMMGPPQLPFQFPAFGNNQKVVVVVRICHSKYQCIFFYCSGKWG